MSDQWPDEPGVRPPLASSSPWVDTSGSGRTTAVIPQRPPADGDRGPLPPGEGFGRTPNPAPRAWLAATAALATLLLLAVGALVWTNAGGDDDTASTRTTTTRGGTTTTRPGASSTRPGAPSTTTPPSTTPPTPPSTTLPSGPAPTAAEVQAEVDVLTPFVQQTRGLTFTTKVPVAVVPNAEFDAQINAQVDAEAPVLAKRAAALQAFGVIDAQVDVTPVWRAVAAVGRYVRYDVTGKRIVVRATALTAFSRAQIVQALTRALDDQHLGISRPNYDAEKDELRWTFASVVAGDGRRVSDAWVATLPPDERAAYARSERQATQAFDPSRLPAALVPLLTSSPETGASFINRLAEGGVPAVDKAFAEPPRTSMQMLHPERYLAGEKRVEVPKPQANGPETDDGVFGEALTAGVLEETVPAAQAGRAADGWAGDWFVLWKGPGGNPCIKVDYKTRDGRELQELEEAFRTWAEEHPGAEINVKDEVLSVQRCAGGVSGRSPV